MVSLRCHGLGPPNDSFWGSCNTIVSNCRKVISIVVEIISFAWLFTFQAEPSRGAVCLKYFMVRCVAVRCGAVRCSADFNLGESYGAVQGVNGMNPAVGSKYFMVVLGKESHD